MDAQGYVYFLVNIFVGLHEASVCLSWMYVLGVLLSPENLNIVLFVS